MSEQSKSEAAAKPQASLYPKVGGTVKAAPVFGQVDALGMLQEAVKRCMAAGLAVAAGDVPGKGLVILVPEATLRDGALALRPAAPVTVTPEAVP